MWATAVRGKMDGLHYLQSPLNPPVDQVGSGHTLGERGGEQAHTLSIAELPTHQHIASASGAPATTNTPTSSLVLAQSVADNAWGPASNLVAMNPAAITNVGGSQAHLNMQPFLTLSFCIALQGIFPSPT